MNCFHSRSHTQLAWRVSMLILIVVVWGSAQAVPYEPELAEPSSDGQDRIQWIQAAEGFKIELTAAEPLLANPVCLYIANSGDIYVAETFRHHKGVSDMRRHTKWLVDDLANRTILDRLITMKKNLGNDFASYSVEHDRVRLLKDTDGDGKMDVATVFADGFKDTLDGIGSGLLEDRGAVYYTCIPDLWKLRDTDGDGQVDKRLLMSSGYGVHISLLGHDTHGLRKGPDGRIYFSIGDRGFHVETENGPLAYPDTGAVLRCNPDGTELEVIHAGLRNPQELVFDNYGNLFTGDNNSDGGDQARWVHIVEGGDSGWLIGYQWVKYPKARGPWETENIWRLDEFDRPAAYLPPLAHVSSGPSGLAYDPGTGIPEKFREHFFLCDFRGNASTSRIHSFHVKPKGASFSLEGREDFVTGLLPTDVDFGTGNGIYLTDWVEGWDQTGKGRIYRIYDPELEDDAIIKETQALLAEEFAEKDSDELLSLLAHPNQRVRFESQWELADRAEDVRQQLAELARNSTSEFARLHSLWALWQIGLTTDTAVPEVRGLVSDKSAHVRAQVAHVLGDLRDAEGFDSLMDLLDDDSDRVRFEAALALGRIGDSRAVPRIAEFLRLNQDRDKYLRHAGVMAFAGMKEFQPVLDLADHPSPSVRMAVLLAFRKRADDRIARFLNDSDPNIVTEAARAINDAPIPGALPALAGLIGKVGAGPYAHENLPLVRRILNAHFRLGAPANAEALAAYALIEEASAQAREEAVFMLEDWEKPSGLDRLIGIWRPLPTRDVAPTLEAVRKIYPKLLSEGPEDVRGAVIETLASLKIIECEDLLVGLVSDKEEEDDIRVEALAALGDLDSDRLREVVQAARQSTCEPLRLEAIAQIDRIGGDAAAEELRAILNEGTTAERKAAFLSLGRLESASKEFILDGWLDRMAKGEVEPEVQLELIHAATQTSQPLRSKIETWRSKFPAETPLLAHPELLLGGDAEKGGDVFFDKGNAQCLRCHTISGRGGGEAGPELTGVGARQTRDYLLEAILFPNNQLARGFENVTLFLTDGTQVAGRVIEEDEEVIKLAVSPDSVDPSFLPEESGLPHSTVDVTAEQDASPPEGIFRGEVQIEVPKEEIEERKRNFSSMPANLRDLLTPFEIRDLVEYLKNLN